jgi:hypothetical protein
VRLEYTIHPGDVPVSLALLANGVEVPTSSLSAETPGSERQYFSERVEAEVGWNTWLSGDMLTHVR